MEGIDPFAEASQALYSTVTAAHIHLSSLGRLSGAHFIIGWAPSHENIHLTLSTNNCPIFVCHSKDRLSLPKLNFKLLFSYGDITGKQMAWSKISLIATALNLGGSKWCLIVIILIRTFIYFVSDFQLCGSFFASVARSHSLTCLTSEGSALRSNKRLMGELISSGFYTELAANTEWITNEEAD